MNKRQYQPRLLTRGEQVFSVVMLFYTTSAVLPFFVGEGDPLSPRQTAPIDLAIKTALYSVAFCFIAIRWRSVIEGARNIKWLVALVVFAVASTAWSQDPSFTFRTSVSLAATTAFGVYFGARYTVPQQLRLLAWTCFLVVSLSLFFAIVLPKYGIHQDAQGAWQGAFLYKNWLAKAMVLAVAVFIFVRPKRFHSLRWLGVVASVALLFLSRSATGLIVCVAIIATLVLCRLVGARNVITVPFFALGLVFVGLLLFQNLTVAGVVQAVGRSPDLTGRTELWSAVLLSIFRRPWLGYGFSEFWLGMHGESASVLQTIEWLPGSAHNGFLDVMLQLGALGLITFCAGYLVFCRRALGFVSRVPGSVSAWLCTYLLFVLLYNLTESSLLMQHSIYWVLYTSTAVSLSPVSFRQFCTE